MGEIIHNFCPRQKQRAGSFSQPSVKSFCFRSSGLPCSQICTQLAAGSLCVVIGSLVADEALLAEQDSAVLFRTLAPVAHPLAITAAFPGTVDNAPPTVTAALDEQTQTISVKVSDLVDGVLPSSSITVTRNGVAEPLENYDAKTGSFQYTLPAPGESGEALRITVTAVDASGNIGRASVDIDSYNMDHKFSDINDYWAATYVDFLYNANITTGYSDGTFRPNQNISRAQFAVMLYRYLKLDESKYADVSLPFADLDTIPEYAIPAVKALYTEGVISGAEKNGRLYFNPNNALTRAQAAAMIGRTQAKGYALANLTFTDSGKIPGYADYYIRTMAAQGVINGYSDGSFKPHSNITRGQMAKILYNLM